MAASNLHVSIQPEFSSTSTKTGFAPIYSIAATMAIKVKGTVITSSLA
jgi:hypothetical protein